MKKIYYIIVVILVFTTQACDEYVDIEPRGSAVASTLEDANALLDNARTLSFYNNNLPALLSDNLQIVAERLPILESDILSEQLPKIYNLQDVFYKGIEEDLTWSSHYVTIGKINNIIELLENIDTDDVLKNQYIAEAKVHRAYHYFYLVNTYGVHYGLPQASEANSGVPILTVFSDDSVSLERATVNQVYEFILNDLNTALPFLLENVISRDRASRAAGLGLLAEVEIHKGNYEEALMHINDALAYNSRLIDYNNVRRLPPISISNIENIFSKSTQNVRIDFRTSLSTYSQELVDITDTTNDLRFAKFVAQNSFGGFQLNRSYVFNVGVTVPKLMLYKAECLARSGSFTEAMDVINSLREKRFATSFVASGSHIISAANVDEALAHIIDESRRELHISGLRFFDVKRLNAIENAGISLTRNGTTYTPNSINWAAPISENIINTSNGQITQNTRE